MVLLTNAPRPASSVLAQLDRLGAPKDCYDLVVSSGDAAQYALFSGAVGYRIHHIGAEKDMPFFTDLAPNCRPWPRASLPSNSSGWTRPRASSAPG